MIFNKKIADTLYKVLTLNKKAGENFFATNKETINSFIVSVILLPFFFIGKITVETTKNNVDINTPEIDLRAYIVILLSYILGWIIWPCFIGTISKTLKKSQDFLSYICIYNWLRLLDIVVIILFSLYSANKNEIFAQISMILSILIVVYQWFCANKIYKVSRFTSFNIVVLDMMFRLFLLRITAYVASNYLPDM
jgi:hypothetical protein